MGLLQTTMMPLGKPIGQVIGAKYSHCLVSQIYSGRCYFALHVCGTKKNRKCLKKENIEAPIEV